MSLNNFALQAEIADKTETNKVHENKLPKNKPDFDVTIFACC